MMFFFLFSIFGVNYFKGRYYSCNTSDNVSTEYIPFIKDRTSCMDYGGDWIILDYNFDDIFHAMITTFKLSITEGW